MGVILSPDAGSDHFDALGRLIGDSYVRRIGALASMFP